MKKQKTKTNKQKNKNKTKHTPAGISKCICMTDIKTDQASQTYGWVSIIYAFYAYYALRRLVGISDNN